MKIFTNIIFIPLILFVSSCFTFETDYEKKAKADEAAILAYLEENGEDAVKSFTGVYYNPLVTNPFGEQVFENSVVSIIYTMRLLSGELIEVYDDVMNPVMFNYSEGALLPQAMLEIGRMRVGEEYRFYIPSYLAFNNYKIDSLFQPNSNFILDVALLNVLPEEFNDEEELLKIENYLYTNGITEVERLPSGIFYIETQEGEGENPKNNSNVKIHFTRTYLNGDTVSTTIKGDPMIVYLGGQNLISGLEEGIKLMKKGGKATIIVPSKLGFGQSIQVIPLKVREALVKDKMLSPATLPYSVLVHEVELLDMIN